MLAAEDAGSELFEFCEANDDFALKELEVVVEATDLLLVLDPGSLAGLDDFGRFPDPTFPSVSYYNNRLI